MIDIEVLRRLAEDAIKSTIPTTAEVYKPKKTPGFGSSGHEWVKNITGVFYREEGKINVVVGDTITKSKPSTKFLITYDKEMKDEYLLYIDEVLYKINDLGEQFKICQDIQIEKTEEVLNVI